MLTYQWAVGRHTCGSTCGHIYWSNVLAYVTKGNTPQMFMKTYSQSLHNNNDKGWMTNG